MINERRRANPSVTMPFAFLALELIMAWLILSIVEWNFNILVWSSLTYAGAGVWLFYLLFKLVRVLSRQKVHSQNSKFI